MELLIPPAALEDKNSFEILRVWAANGEQHVSIRSDLNGDASDFGYLLAQLAFHGAKLYSGRTGNSENNTFKKIIDRFEKELENNTGDPTGKILE